MYQVIYFYCLVVVGIFACACSQLLLKKSADKERGRGIIATILNWRVILAYAIFFCSLFINITAMSKGVNLKDLPILESLGYIFVPLLSFVVLKEHISWRTVVSMMFIISGVCVFYL